MRQRNVTAAGSDKACDNERSRGLQLPAGPASRWGRSRPHTCRLQTPRNSSAFDWIPACLARNGRCPQRPGRRSIAQMTFDELLSPGILKAVRRRLRNHTRSRPRRFPPCSRPDCFRAQTARKRGLHAADAAQAEQEPGPTNKSGRRHRRHVAHAHARLARRWKSHPHLRQAPSLTSAAFSRMGMNRRSQDQEGRRHPRATPVACRSAAEGHWTFPRRDSRARRRGPVLDWLLPTSRDLALVQGQQSRLSRHLQRRDPGPRAPPCEESESIQVTRETPPCGITRWCTRRVAARRGLRPSDPGA